MYWDFKSLNPSPGVRSGEAGFSIRYEIKTSIVTGRIRNSICFCCTTRPTTLLVLPRLLVFVCLIARFCVGSGGSISSICVTHRWGRCWFAVCFHRGWVTTMKRMPSYTTADNCVMMSRKRTQKWLKENVLPVLTVDNSEQHSRRSKRLCDRRGRNLAILGW